MVLETQKGDIWFFAYEKFTEFDRIVFCINGLISGKINIKRSTKIHTHTHAHQIRNSILSDFIILTRINVFKRNHSRKKHRNNKKKLISLMFIKHREIDEEETIN